MLDSNELEQLVAASRGAGGHGSDWQSRMPEVVASMRQLLQLIQEGVAEGEEAQAARQQALLLCFRALRNTCAAGPAACTQLLSLGLLDLVRATLDLVSTAAISLNWQLPAAVSQTLANLCNAGGEAAAAAAWAALFPLHLTMLAHINTGPTQAATCLALLACCKEVMGAAGALAGSQASQLMTALLCNHQRLLQQGEGNDNLGLLAAHLCFQKDLLPTLFEALRPEQGSCDNSDGGRSGSGVMHPTLAQVALLEALCEEAHEAPQQADTPTGDKASSCAGCQQQQQRQGASMQFLVDLVQQLAARSGPPPHPPLTQGQQQVLQEALRLMRDVCARDDSGRGLSGGACLVAELQAAGFLPALLAMLKALAPIQSPAKQRQAAEAAAAAGGAAPAPGGAAAGSSSGGGDGSNGGGGDSGGIQVAELAPQLAQQAQRFHAEPPYHGFRSDLLSVVANAAHGRPSVQGEVHGLGGVELVLAQCQWDRQSPLAREWALWGVRNLCEGNPKAQEAIRELQLCTTVESEELQRLGVKLEMDEQTGKLKVSKRDPPPHLLPSPAGAS